MASHLEFVNYVVEQLQGVGAIASKKMFGEYMVYVNEKPVILICDDTAYVKKLECVKVFLENGETGFPYDGAKEHYILDVDNREMLRKIITEVEKVTLIPKKKRKVE